MKPIHINVSNGKEATATEVESPQQRFWANPKKNHPLPHFSKLTGTVRSWTMLDTKAVSSSRQTLWSKSKERKWLMDDASKV
jgi:hypothetical protein